MLKFEKKMAVSDEEFYNLILEGLKRDLKSAGIVEDRIHEGLKFKKNLKRARGQEVTSTVEVIKLVQNKEYQVQFKSAIDILTVSYLVERVDDYEIILTYKEELTSDSARISINHKITQFILKTFFSKRKLKKRFKEMEVYLINFRKG